MSGNILQINFRFNVSVSDYISAVTSLAGDIGNVSDLQWKLWLMNGDEREAGETHWFSDYDSLMAYREGPIVAIAGTVNLSIRLQRPGAFELVRSVLRSRCTALAGGPAVR